MLNLLVARSLFVPLMLAGGPLSPWPGSRHPQIHAVAARQLARFEQYTRLVLGCGWDLPEAHVCDDPATPNPASPTSIRDCASWLWGLNDRI